MLSSNLIFLVLCDVVLLNTLIGQAAHAEMHVGDAQQMRLRTKGLKKSD